MWKRMINLFRLAVRLDWWSATYTLLDGSRRAALFLSDPPDASCNRKLGLSVPTRL